MGGGLPLPSARECDRWFTVQNITTRASARAEISQLLYEYVAPVSGGVYHVKMSVHHAGCMSKSLVE